MKDLNILKSELKELLPSSIYKVIEELKKILPDGTKKANDIILLEGQLEDVDRKSLRDTISNEELTRTYNKIRSELLDFIDALEDEDLLSLEKTNKSKKGIQKGELLYKIPELMKLNENSKCKVRIAFNEEDIKKGLKIDDDITFRKLNRVSKSMEVTLIYPFDDTPFEIKPINDPIQLVLEDDFTEWTFFIKPLKVGKFPLLIKIAVIELIFEKERKRELVFEEEIEVTTIDLPENQLHVPFKKSNNAFILGGISSFDSIKKSSDIESPASSNFDRFKKIVLSKVGILSLVFGFIIFAYTSSLKEDYYMDNVNDVVVLAAEGNIPDRIELDQGWGDKGRKLFWYTSTGSDIMPYDWFTWLEQSNNDKLFRDSEFMESLGYLPQDCTDLNPSGLPIGFTVTRHRKNKPRGFGLSCAACHTNQLDYQDSKILVEGAPTLANFEKFYGEIVKSLNATHTEPAKFERFAKRVLADSYSQSSSVSLRTKIEELAIKCNERQTINALPNRHPKDFTGHARLDAFTNIMNAGSALALHDPENKNYPIAPVSYPYLWGTPQSDVVHWNASAPNTPVVGPLIRNANEAVGVFGGLSIDPSSWWQQLVGTNVKYTSNIDFRGLGKLQSLVTTLRSPEWPEDLLPKLDVEKVARGAIIFADRCQSCHEIIPRSEEGQLYIANKTLVSELGTDPLVAENYNNYTAKSLILKGEKKEVIYGDPFGVEATAIDIPINGVLGLLLKRPKTAIKAGLMPAKNAGVHADAATLKELLKEHQEKRNNNISAHKDSLVYKGRPLNGIWATAPYLHNGSVPNLWQLLTLPEDRVKEFHVGSREFDPINVGFITDSGPSLFRVLKQDSTIMPGNSNLGHYYCEGLTEDDKWNLLEYLKSL